MKRRQHTPEFKFKVVKETLKERHNIQELACRFEVHLCDSPTKSKVS
ncbi:MAG: transposase [Flavobacteriaceae bacterium]|nr:transposase [Flavobacteriaceae bacterium]